MAFNIEQAKKQVDAVPKLALPYFLDACDEIEKLREEVDGLERAYAVLENRMGRVTTP